MSFFTRTLRPLRGSVRVRLEGAAAPPVPAPAPPVTTRSGITRAPHRRQASDAAAQIRATDAPDPRPRCAEKWCRQHVARVGERCDVHQDDRSLRSTS